MLINSPFIYVGRSLTQHIFCFTFNELHNRNAFLVVVWPHKPLVLCSVSPQNSKQKHVTKNFARFPNHSLSRWVSLGRSFWTKYVVSRQSKPRFLVLSITSCQSNSSIVFRFVGWDETGYYRVVSVGRLARTAPSTTIVCKTEVLPSTTSILRPCPN